MAPFVAEELGAAMGVSTQSAMSLMADALDLRHRFPLLWAKVEAGEVAPTRPDGSPPTPARCPSRARWVDVQLAARVDGFGIPTIERLVALAAARFAPEEQAEKEKAAQSGWQVTPSHPRPGDFAGTSWLDASGDTADLETRKAKALGIIAGRQGCLELTEGGPDGRQVTRRPVQTHLYVHVSLADLATHTTGQPGVGEVEKLGPATLT